MASLVNRPPLAADGGVRVRRDALLVAAGAIVAYFGILFLSALSG